MKSWARTFALVVLAGYVGFAQQALPKAPAPVARPATVRQLPTAAPESVGVSSERLERLHKGMQAFVDRHEAGGIVTLVAREARSSTFTRPGFRTSSAARR